jgi:hypothetical protein
VVGRPPAVAAWQANSTQPGILPLHLHLSRGTEVEATCLLCTASCWLWGLSVAPYPPAWCPTKTYFCALELPDLFHASPCMPAALTNHSSAMCLPSCCLQSFPTNHIVIRGKFSSIHLALYGQCYSATLSSARGQGIATRPAILPLPKDAAATPQAADAGAGPAAAAAAAAVAPVDLLQVPGISRPPLPLATLPPKFADALLTAARYWRLVRLSHGSISRSPPHDRFDALFKVGCCAGCVAPVPGVPGSAVWRDCTGPVL